MPRLVSRILLGALLVPGAYIVDFIAMIYLDRFNWPVNIWAANCFAAALLVIGWLLLWRGLVSWSAARIFLTAAAMLPAFLIAMVAGKAIEDGFIPFDVFAYVWLTALLWMSFTAFIWRETASERRARLVGV